MASIGGDKLSDTLARKPEGDGRQGDRPETTHEMAVGQAPEAPESRPNSEAEPSWGAIGGQRARQQAGGATGLVSPARPGECRWRSEERARAMRADLREGKLTRVLRSEEERGTMSGALSVRALAEAEDSLAAHSFGVGTGRGMTDDENQKDEEEEEYGDEEEEGEEEEEEEEFEEEEEEEEYGYEDEEES